MLKGLLLASLLLSPTTDYVDIKPSKVESAQLSAPFQDAPIGVDILAVRHISCGTSMGTAFYIGNGNFMTADHVSRNGACYDTLSEIPMPLVERSASLDYAIVGSSKLSTILKLKPFRMSCAGFKTGENYYNIGFSAGERLTLNPLIASNYYSDNNFVVEGHIHDHLRRLNGSIIQGQSGGPIIDDNSTVIGINNVTSANWTIGWSRELKDLPICQGK